MLTLLLFLSFLLFLYYPRVVSSGASWGLLLWYKSLLPTLFPFMVITSLILHTQLLDSLPEWIVRPLKSILHTSVSGVFCVLAGFLCGCPTGGKIIGDLVKSGKLNVDEGEHLLGFCTHISPMYLLGFVYPKLSISKGKFIFLIYGIPLLYGIFSNYILFKKASSKAKKKLQPVENSFSPASALPIITSSRTTLNFATLVDTCLTESLAVILKVAGYIILCSVYSALLSQWNIVPDIIPAFLEITGGVSLLRSETMLIGLCSFGGICMYLQLQCALSGSGLSVKKCIKTKLSLAFISMIFFFI